MSAEATLARLLLAGLSPQQIEREIGGSADPTLRAAVARHSEALPRLRAMLDAARIDHGAASPETIAAMFDAAAALAPEAAVALYSLGSRERLEAASEEIAAWLAQQKLVTPEASVLDLGCGIGRMGAALRGRARFLVGTDMSAAMLREARRRLPEGSFVRGTGHDLGGFASSSFDLVLAVDSFPYLFLAGEDVADRHVSEAVRVLRPRGAIAIMNLSYRNDASRDAADAARWASLHGLVRRENGCRPFTTWDGAAFVLTSPDHALKSDATAPPTFR